MVFRHVEGLSSPALMYTVLFNNWSRGQQALINVTISRNHFSPISLDLCSYLRSEFKLLSFGGNTCEITLQTNVTRLRSQVSPAWGGNRLQALTVQKASSPSPGWPPSLINSRDNYLPFNAAALASSHSFTRK